jgi:hypothetical protein
VTLPDVPAVAVPAAAALEAALELAGAVDELDEPLLHAATARVITVSAAPIT